MGLREEYKETDNSSVWRKLHKRFHARCSICPWHGNENAGPYKKFGKTKSKKKEHRTSLLEETPLDDDIKYVMGQFDDSETE